VTSSFSSEVNFSAISHLYTKNMATPIRIAVIVSLKHKEVSAFYIN
jgi:hypothetical protein